MENINKYNEDVQDYVTQEFDSIQGPKSTIDQSTQYGDGVSFSNLMFENLYDASEVKAIN